MDRFIATVKSTASAEKLRKTFEAFPLGETPFEVTTADKNEDAIKSADVVLLWSALPHLPHLNRGTSMRSKG